MKGLWWYLTSYSIYLCRLRYFHTSVGAKASYDLKGQGNIREYPLELRAIYSNSEVMSFVADNFMIMYNKQHIDTSVYYFVLIFTK